MRFTYAEAMTDATYYLPLAQAAEQAGYTSITVADSLIYPRDSDSEYPYTDDGNREFLEDKEFIETFTLIAAMGAVTSTLRFTPFVLKLPVRPPVLVAKQASSVAYLTGNRLGLGVGLSPWPEDFAVMGVPWAAPRQADGRVRRHRPRPHVGRLLRVPRRVLRLRRHQADARPDRADPDPRRRPLRRGSASRRTTRRRVDARRW